jgi:hypothetical protein
MNSITHPVHSRPHAATLLRWAARVSSVLVGALIFAFLFEPAAAPNAKEIVALALFPGGVLLGMAIGWWREMPGAAVSLGSLGAFYLWMLIATGQLPGGPYFLILTAPAFLFLAAGLLERTTGHRGSRPE